MRRNTLRLILIALLLAPGPALADTSELRVLRDAHSWSELASRARNRLAEAERLTGTDSPAVVELLELLVEALVRTQRTREPETLRWAERAVRWHEGSAQPDSARLGRSLWALAATHLLGADFDTARPIFERALHVQETALGPDHPDLAETLQGYAKLLLDTDHVTEARGVIDRSLAVGERNWGLEDRRLAPLLRTRASILRLQQDFAGALADRRRAFLVCEQGYGPEHVQTALAMNAYARSLRATGEDDSANALDRRALAVFEKLEGSDSAFLLYPSFDLCGGFVNIGAYDEARPHCERAVAILERTRGPDHPEVLVGLAALARLELATGNAEVARALSVRCVDGLTKTLGPEHSRVAFAIHRLGDAEAASGRLEAAGRHLESALRLREVLYGPDHEALAENLYGLAQVRRRAAQFPEARAAAERALTIVETARGKDSPLVVPALRTLADVLAGSGEPGRALEINARALELQERHNGPFDPALADLLAAQAGLLLEVGRGAEAFETALRAETIAANHLRVIAPGLGEADVARYEAIRVSGIDIALSLVDSTSGVGFVRRAWDRQVRSRALVLDELASRTRAVRAWSEPGVAALADRVTSTRQRLANLVVRSLGEAATANDARLIADARLAGEEAERELAARSAVFRREIRGREIGLDDVEAARPEGAALVAFIRFERRGGPPGSSFEYVAFVLPAGVGSARCVPLGDAVRIERAVDAWNRAILDGTRSRRAATPDAERKARVAGAEVRRLLWDPVSPRLGPASSAFIVPDGAVNLVSFEALPDGTGAYLLERGPAIHYLATERDLRSLDGNGAPVRPGSLLVVGGVDYDARFPRPAVPLVPSGVTTGARAPLFRGVSPSCPGFQALEFVSLPGTAEEARDVSDAWRRSSLADGAPSPAELSGGRAREEAVKRTVPGREIIHFATHGFYLGDDCGRTRGVGVVNPLLLSGLALAGANRRDASAADADDGILTAEEITALDLGRARLVVLSACGTAGGPIVAGEGVFGLRRAFEVAGARRFVTTQWPAEDRATRSWMSAFYREVFGSNRPIFEAARAASLERLRALRAAGKPAHPLLWGGFMTSGDWRPIN